tara:strand:- start:445 stop:1125 length:681 start_codon:yes stop_codon:yes gene_type:complete
MLDTKITDFFSSYMTGEKIMNKQNQDRYESSPGCVFDTAINEVPFISLVDIDVKSKMASYALHSPELVWGLVRFDMGILRPLDSLTAQTHTRHLRQISTKEDMRGYGFFKIAMEKILEVAEESGIFLHGTSCPFILKWPEIENYDEMIWFLDNENKFFGDQRGWKEQKNKSRQLLKKYQEFGCCKFRYPSGNGFSRRWMRNNAGFGYMSSQCNGTVRETLENYLSC